MIQYVMDHYDEVGQTVDSSSQVYKTLCKDIPQYLRGIIDEAEFYTIKGSMGAANKVDCPWIAIMDRNITHSTQKGLYDKFLFDKGL